MAAKFICLGLVHFLLGTNLSWAFIPLPCTPIWKSVLKAEPLPQDAAATHGSEYFIARRSLNDYAGWVKNSTGIAYLNTYRDHRETKEHLVYDVLANPHDCSLSWERVKEGGAIPPEDKRFMVPYKAKGDRYVAITPSEIEKAEVGAILRGEFCYLINANETTEKVAGACKFLKSTINLRCELTNFDFEGHEVEEGDPDFLGLDVINNEAETYVTQTVIHSKTFTEQYTFTESSSFSKVDTFDVTVGIPIDEDRTIGLDFKYENRVGNSQTASVGHTRENEVTSTRTVIVPPFTAVEICSVVSLQDDYQMPYKARGRYSIKGKTAAEVLEILRLYPIEDIEIFATYEHSVLANVPGKIGVSIPTKTRFIIAEPNDPNGCKQIQGNIQKLKLVKAFGTHTKSMLDELRQTIKYMIEHHEKN